jgi:hypothetical protein
MIKFFWHSSKLNLFFLIVNVLFIFLVPKKALVNLRNVKVNSNYVMKVIEETINSTGRFKY